MIFNNVCQVAAQRLCIGCGACASVCPEKKVQLVDIVDDGIRPIRLEGPEAGKPKSCGDCGLCLEVCPGFKTILSPPDSTVIVNSLEKRWGGIIELWEGYAADPEIRFKGSSGGLCTALSLFCLQNGKAGGVLHIGADKEFPWKNRTYFSKHREDLIERTGSRYSPASPCDGLAAMESAETPSVFVGKPCDVAGLRMSQALRPELDGNTYLAIGFFCAGTPSTRGTLELLKNHNTDPDEISGFRYRGLGWPGKAAAWRQNDDQPFLEVSYQDSWGFVQKYRPFRCYLCPDLTAEFADISVGDPWYRELGDGDPGRSLILIRTAKGRDIFHRAMEEGYVTADPAKPDIIYRSQKNLLFEI